MSTLPLRPARTTDPDEVDRLYEICLRTGASGADATPLYTCLLYTSPSPRD